MNRTHITWIITALALLLITGCTSKEVKIKQNLLTSFEQHTQFENFRFAGSADLQLSGTLTTAADNADHLTAMLLQPLLDGQFTWEGTWDKSAGRWEMSLGVTPAEADVSFHIPMILDQQAVYFRLPLLNQQDEYWTLNIDELGHRNVQQLGDSFHLIFQRLVAELDTRWFSAQQLEASRHTRIHIKLTQDNLLQWLATMKETVPSILTELEQNGLIDRTVRTHWEQWSDDPELVTKARQLIVNEPGGLTFTVNEAEQVIGYSVSLNISQTKDSEPLIIQLDYKLEDVNEQPAFTLELPEHTRHVQEILDLLPLFSSP